MCLILHMLIFALLKGGRGKGHGSCHQKLSNHLTFCWHLPFHNINFSYSEKGEDSASASRSLTPRCSWESFWCWDLRRFATKAVCFSSISIMEPILYYGILLSLRCNFHNFSTYHLFESFGLKVFYWSLLESFNQDRI